MLEELALAIGSRGMAGGQAMDLAAEGQQLDLAQLEDMHVHKTGALIRTSVRLGALSATNCPPEILDQLDRYAKTIGLAFQIRDDILDEEGDTSVLGKPQGSDRVRKKSTYPAVLGMPGAKEMAAELHTRALESLSGMDERADPLRWIATYVVARTY
jgi:farnesyl diphosphate synthase